MLIALLLAGCAGRTVLVYDVPAEITVPQDVRALGVVDRKGTDLSKAARDALVEELQGGPRFTVVDAASAQAALAKVQGTVGQPLDGDAVRTLRTASAADGVVAVDQVEAVDGWTAAPRMESRTRTESRRPADCPTCEPVVTEVTDEVQVIDATLEVQVTVGYQLYGADGALLDAWTETVVDRRTGTGDTEADARREVGAPREIAEEAAAATAFEAARHIAPWTTQVERRYYRTGGPEVKAGAKLAKAGDWTGAERAWKASRKTAEGDAKGRVLFNLAVAAERRGDIAGALELAKAAKKHLRKPEKAEAYMAVLKERRRQAKTLAAQMVAEPEVRVVE